MGLEVLLVAVIIVGGFAAFRRSDAAGRSARRTLGMGRICTVGGCAGALGALDAATSGQRNLVSGFNPYLFSFVFFIGVGLLIAGAVRALSRQPESQPPEDIG